MKLFRGSAHLPAVTRPHDADVSPNPATFGPLGSALDFDDVYKQWFGTVMRWLRTLGGPHADTEDLAQEVFLVVQRKLSSFDGKHLGAWLYRIVKFTLSDHRRRAWFVHLVRGRGALEDVEGPNDPFADLAQREHQRALHRLVGRMSRSVRETFLLYEVLGHTGEEIAAMQSIPLNTVWTRLHAGRKQFMVLVKADPYCAALEPFGRSMRGESK